MPTSRFQPALLGGLFLGVLSALPIISMGNVCCCLWVIAGGVVAAYLLQNNQPTPITTGDGATVGLLAGVIGAIVWQVLAIPITLMMGPIQARMIERILQSNRDLPENVRPIFDALRHNAGFGVLRFIIGFVFVLIVCLIFSTVGGLIGAALFRKKPLPGSPPDLSGPVAP